MRCSTSRESEDACAARSPGLWKGTGCFHGGGGGPGEDAGAGGREMKLLLMEKEKELRKWEESR